MAKGKYKVFADYGTEKSFSSKREAEKWAKTHNGILVEVGTQNEKVERGIKWIAEDLGLDYKNLTPNDREELKEMVKNAVEQKKKDVGKVI